MRAVLVQPTASGTDNGGMLTALAALGPAARGVAIVPESVSERGLDLLGAQGIAGLRCFMLGDANRAMRWDCAALLAPRIAERGWHMDFALDGSLLPEREAALRHLPGSLVIDQMGRLPLPVDPGGPELAALLRCLDTGRVWVKLSLPAEAGEPGQPGCEDIALLARRLVAHAPDRCLWGSNWPHHPQPQMQDVFGLLREWAPGEKVRRQILVENPAALYRFAAP
jgi:D-galactarolactone isomerase